MHLRNVLVKLALPLALLAVAFAASGNGQPDYDQRLRPRLCLCLHQEPQEAHKPRVRGRVREGWFAAGDSLRRRHDLLAHLRRYALVRPERQTTSIRRSESDGHWQSFRARWIACPGHRQDRTSIEFQVDSVGEHDRAHWRFSLSTETMNGEATRNDDRNARCFHRNDCRIQSSGRGEIENAKAIIWQDRRRAADGSIHPDQQEWRGSGDYQLRRHGRLSESAGPQRKIRRRRTGLRHARRLRGRQSLYRRNRRTLCESNRTRHVHARWHDLHAGEE